MYMSLACSRFVDQLTAVAPKLVVQVYGLGQLTSSDHVFKIEFNFVGILLFNAYLSLDKNQ